MPQAVMSGRQKQPLTPEQEREQLRQLTRELHEAAQGARDAARDLRAARKEITAETGAAVRQMTEERWAELALYFDERWDDMNRVIGSGERQTREHYAEMLRADGRELILRTCAMVLHLSIPGVTVDGWLQQIAEDTANHRLRGCSCTGCLVADPAQVMVATRESLDAFIAAGGDPGFVIDGT
jgi:hypothetical protein